MMNRWDCYRSSLDFAMSRDFFDGTEGTTVKLARNRVGTYQVRINHSDKSHRLSMFSELMINASVIAAKRACANDGDVDEVVSYQYSVPADSIVGF
jgi:hypothetical protein